MRVSQCSHSELTIQKLENRANSLIYQRYVALKTWLWAHSRTQKYIMNNQYHCQVLLAESSLITQRNTLF